MSETYKTAEKRSLYPSYDKDLVKRVKEQLDNSQENPLFDENSVSVLRMRYLRKDEGGKFMEDPKGMVTRVASIISYPEYVYSGNDEKKMQNYAEKFYQLMASGRFMPNSPTLMNAGRGTGLMSACFVLPVGDSIKEIFDSVGLAAEIQKAGGGTGFAFDRLRPTGDYIYSSGGNTSGPISFWRVFSEATNAIQQGAFRRGANMGMMGVYHPDVINFFRAKRKDGEFSNFNISIKLTDEWMKEFYDNPDSPFVVKNPRTGKEYYIPAKAIESQYSLENLIQKKEGGNAPEGILTKGQFWKMMVENAYHAAEPGVIFIDEMNRGNPTPEIGAIESTNPCGEQPLLPYEACNLGSINLARYVKERKIDYESLRRDIKLAVRFLDDVIDMNNFPDEKKRIENIVLGNRKIGLGIMGFADMLAELRIRYGSEDSLKLGEEVMRFLRTNADEASEELAAERGVFPNFGKSVYSAKTPRRNAATTSIAPTGTISIIAGALGGGIEPFFKLFYKHKDSEGNLRYFFNRAFLEDLKEAGLDSEKIKNDLIEEKSLEELDVPDWIKETYVTAHDITPEQHVRMQAVFQKYCDSSISKTINLRHDAPIEEVDKVYRLAHKLKCKGITVYRDGTKKGQPLSSIKEEKKETLAERVRFHVPIKMNAMTIADDSVKYRVERGNDVYHILFTDEFRKDPKTNNVYGFPREIFQQSAPPGDEISVEFTVAGIDRTNILKEDDPDYDKLITRWKSITGNRSAGLGSNRVNSPSHAVGLATEHHLLTNGIVRYDESGRLEVVIRKKDTVPLSKEEKEEMRKKGFKTNGRIEQNIANKSIASFKCKVCGSEEYYFEGGCHSPKCKECSWTQGDCG